MKKTLLFILFMLTSCKTKPILVEDKINILFIGNSLTYYHDMPKTLQAMLNEKSNNFNIEQSTFPGMTLKSHLEDIIINSSKDNIRVREKSLNELTETEKKLQEKNWDFIILQDVTQNQYFPEVTKEVTEPTILKIKQQVKNKDCTFIIFSTWPSIGDYPRKKMCIPKHYFDWKKYYVNEEVSNKEKFCSTEIINLEEDIKILNESYNNIKEVNNLLVSNHPNLHYKVRTNFPEIELYDDDYHPSEIGSFLNALEFYRIFSNEKVDKLQYNGKLDSETAKKLKNIFK
ncbi:DUF4886 domain-containing protein [Flavobacterium sp. j3]|uniref:DUF4886 domain-containing protein n=1 Tax=Flavobacterium aureirubrum TaxID=3133147 RepID=A0ABU9N8M1_9FLAO